MLSLLNSESGVWRNRTGHSQKVSIKTKNFRPQKGKECTPSTGKSMGENPEIRESLLREKTSR